MLLDMSQILSGAVDSLDFSYTLSAKRVPYADAPDMACEADAAGVGTDGGDDEELLPIVFEDVVVTEPVRVKGTVVNRAGYIKLTAEASISYRTHCARCLAEVEDTAYFQSRQRVLDMLSGLTDLEAQVLTMRFGLDGKAPASPQQTGEKLNITADEVVRMEAAALAKLRKDG